MSCLICNELLLIITCGLITCVSPYATLLVHLILSVNYQNQIGTFQGPARAALSPCQGGLLAWPVVQDRGIRRLGARTEAVLAGTPARGRVRPWSARLEPPARPWPGSLGRGRHVSGRSGSQTRSLSSEGSPRTAYRTVPSLAQ